MARPKWKWIGLTIVAMAVIAFIGEALLHDEPDWLILVVAVAAGLAVGRLVRLARRAAPPHTPRRIR